MTDKKKRPITFIKEDDRESVIRRKRAALEWQKRQLALELPCSLLELEDAADYCKGSKQGMSSFLNGNREMHEDALNRFADACGVRLSYLRMIDDLMTDEDVMRSGGVTRVHAILLQIALLKDLGYSLESRLELFVNEWKNANGVVQPPFTKEEWSEIKPTITGQGLSFEVQTFDGKKIPLHDWDGDFENVCTRNFSLRAKCTVRGSATNGYVPYRAGTPDFKGLSYKVQYTISKDGYSFDMRMDELDSIFNNVTGYLNVEMGSRIQFCDTYQKQMARLPRRSEHGND